MCKFFSYHQLLPSMHMFIVTYLICKEKGFDNAPLWSNHRVIDTDCWLGV